MPRPVLSVLLATTLACQPADRPASDTGTTAAVPEPPAAGSQAAAGTDAGAATVPGARAASPQLLVPGDHYSGSVNTVTGETWLGLFRADSGWALRATDVTVVAIPNPCADTGSQKTGRRVGVDQPGSPLFLVRHVPALEPGPAHGALTGLERLHPGERREFDLGSPPVRWAIAAYGSVPAPRAGGPGQDAIREYTLAVSRTPWTTWQPLFTFQAPASGAGVGLRAPPAVLWAGDASGDGNLDVFMDFTAGDLPGPLVLYLSNPGGSELVRKVAQHQPGRCDPETERPQESAGDTTRAQPETQRGGGGGPVTP